MVDQRDTTTTVLIVIVISIVGLAVRILMSGLVACLFAPRHVIVGGHVGWGEARGHRSATCLGP